MTTGTARVWTLNPMNMPLTVSLRARLDTTQVMLGVSLRATWDTTLVQLIVTVLRIGLLTDSDNSTVTHVQEYHRSQMIMPIKACNIISNISGADNGTNRANCDTSTKFGTNVLWGLLVKSARWATLKSKMAAIFFQDGRHFHYTKLFKKIKWICLVDFSDLNVIIYILAPS